MATDDLDFANLDQLTQLIKDAGVSSVSTDASEVRTPGVWIRLVSIPPGTLAGLTLRLTVNVVVANSTTRTRTESALADLFNQVMPVITEVGGPSGDITPIGLVLPGSQTPLPCLSIPLDLLTTNQE